MSVLPYESINKGVDIRMKILKNGDGQRFRMWLCQEEEILWGLISVFFERRSRQSKRNTYLVEQPNKPEESLQLSSS